MNAKKFWTKYANTVKAGNSKIKLRNRARKWGLLDTKGNVYEAMQGMLSLEECEEFTRQR